MALSGQARHVAAEPPPRARNRGWWPGVGWGCASLPQSLPAPRTCTRRVRASRRDCVAAWCGGIVAGRGCCVAAGCGGVVSPIAWRGCRGQRGRAEAAKVGLEEGEGPPGRQQGQAGRRRWVGRDVGWSKGRLGQLSPATHCKHSRTCRPQPVVIARRRCHPLVVTRGSCAVAGVRGRAVAEPCGVCGRREGGGGCGGRGSRTGARRERNQCSKTGRVQQEAAGTAMPADSAGLALRCTWVRGRALAKPGVCGRLAGVQRRGASHAGVQRCLQSRRREVVVGRGG
jgi:hypothetical protein